MGRLVGTFMLALAVLLLGVVAGLVALSPGTPSPVLDEDGRPVPGSGSEKLRVEIGGVEQEMFLRGRDPENPVLLFVHGGAGMPEYFLAQRYPATLALLEEHFTVCWSDRRGAGLSWSPEVPPESMTVEQMISDLLEVTDWLRERFGQRRIYLMAHSGGTFFALQAVARAPERYDAYLGIGQIAHQLRSENVAYRYMLERFRTLGDEGMVRRLESAPVPMSVPLPDACMRVRDEAMHRLGVGTTREMRSVVQGVFLASWRSPDYTLREKVGIWRGKAFSDALLWDTILATDLGGIVREVGVPLYFLHGAHDYTVTRAEPKRFVDALEAPVKGFDTFPEAAHSPMFEEPERLRRILEEDVLRGTTALADPE